MQKSRNQRTQGDDNTAVKKLKKLVDDSLGAGFLGIQFLVFEEA